MVALIKATTASLVTCLKVFLASSELLASPCTMIAEDCVPTFPPVPQSAECIMPFRGVRQRLRRNFPISWSFRYLRSCRSVARAVGLWSVLVRCHRFLRPAKDRMPTGNHVPIAHNFIHDVVDGDLSYQSADAIHHGDGNKVILFDGLRHFVMEVSTCTEIGSFCITCFTLETEER